jgi:hypothetical protein
MIFPLFDLILFFTGWSSIQDKMEQSSRRLRLELKIPYKSRPNDPNFKIPSAKTEALACLGDQSFADSRID